MTNRKSTKRALLGSVMAMVLCLAMLVGATFAWFTDTASTGVNKIQAGNLDVQLVDENGNSLEGKTLEFKKAANAAEGEAVKQLLLKAADINAAVQAQTPSFIKEHYRQLSGMTNAYVCGVGANLGTASEGALKFGETVSIPTAVYEVEEYIHGPNIQMTPRYSVFLIDGGEGTERIHRIFEGTQIVTDNVFLLTRCADYKDEHNVMYVPMDVPEEITPLCWLPFFQMTACQLTNDLDRWNKHPLQRAMEKFVSSKSANYVNSPFSEDTPGRA